MNAEALRGWNGVVAAVLVLTGCAWEVVPPGKSEERLDRPGDSSVAAEPEQITREVTPCDPQSEDRHVGPFRCGETFATTIWGECNDCGDLGCTQAEPAVIANCACAATVEYCYPNSKPRAVCSTQGTECECDDGKGPIYECDCEDQVTSPNECTCRPPLDVTLPPFDYELECEQ